ncbi:HipA domain-containing protein [Paraburkholderia phosphatilytica]|uniref:HipA domain-containing protein n=1 Tax=Paraburkholderia phosphatilytica TaxID=2282883 RepID=UPI000E4E11B5|nr:HipA domain-containing protein [Paraburkholderia phosphatilytica]
MAHLLHVATQAGTVGQLAFESRDDQYSFRYDDAWRAKDGAFALSPHIPLAGSEPGRGVVHRFLANLLPEGRALDVASIVYQMSKDNTFGLVRMLGKEPVGALSFRAANDDAATASNNAGIDDEPERRVITNEELSERIRERDTIPFPVWDRKVRMSVAGYQDKLQVLVEGDRISLADGAALSSTHILKPESRNANTPHMVANEHYCMTLAARIGLPVAAVTIRRIPEPILLIERFDREASIDKADGVTVRAVRRLHIIDGCQALDLPVSFKYERNFGHTRDVRHIREGVSFEKLFSLDPHLALPAAARQWMLRWALFQLFIGNSDAHGKNLSFFVRNSGLAPAPFYDLVSVNAYGENVEQEMALGYGDAFRLEEVTPLELADFANRARVPGAVIARELARMARAVQGTASELAESDIYEGDERDLVQHIAAFIGTQAARLAQIAPGITKVDRALI